MILLALLLGWMALLNKAAALNIAQKAAYIKEEEERQQAERQEEQQAETQDKEQTRQQEERQAGTQEECQAKQQEERQAETPEEQQAGQENTQQEKAGLETEKSGSEQVGQPQTAGQEAEKEDAKEGSSPTVKTWDRKANPDIRVLLMDTDYQTFYHPSVTVSYGGNTVTYTPESPEFDNGPVTIPAQEDGIEISSIRRQDGAPVYQGSMEIRRQDGALLLINRLPLETYLEAVVPSEMPSSYEMEALKAQAVCARTYAWKQMEEGRLQEYGADVDDSVNYQVYGNISPQDSTTRAVRETEGEVICQNGELIEAYYFSTSAGATSTDEIWGAEEAASYLKSVSCTFDAEEPWGKWSVEIPWSSVEQRAQSHEAGGALKGLEAIKKNQSGAVISLRVVMEEASFEVSEEYAIREFLSPKDCTITGQNGMEVQGGQLLPSAYFTINCIPGETVCIEGGGYGHGVGMSQTAADQMAKEGYTYGEILDYFFKDIEILKAR